MDYILIAKCDVCGKSFCWEGERSDRIHDIVTEKLDFTKRGERMLCRICDDNYQVLQKTHSQELHTFLKGNSSNE